MTVDLDVVSVFNQFAKDRAGPAAAREYANAPGRIAALWRETADLGWADLVGGRDEFVSMRTLASVFEALGSRLFPGFAMDAYVGSNLLLAEVELASPDLGLTVVVSEWTDRAGVPARSWPTVRIEEGTLTGEVDGVSYARIADTLVVPCTGDEGRQLALARPGTAGLRVTEQTSVDRLDLPDKVAFDQCPATVIPVSGDILTAAWQRYLDAVRVLTAAEVVGVCQTMVTMAVDFAKERIAFDRPIGSFQAIQHMIADASAEVYALRSLTDFAAAAIDAGDGSALALSAKLRSATTAQSVREVALQVHGGIGFTDEHDLGLYFRRAMTLEGRGGEAPGLLRERAAAVFSDLSSSGRR
jgi:alkylation response protein AidB-like acyl-CoA dehydrogenase